MGRSHLFVDAPCVHSVPRTPLRDLRGERRARHPKIAETSCGRAPPGGAGRVRGACPSATRCLVLVSEPWAQPQDLSRCHVDPACGAEGEAVIWLASKDRARSREAFLRSVRATLRRLGVDVSRLCGRWLILAGDCAVDAAQAAQETPTPRQDPAPELEADRAKIISLGWSSAPKRSCLHVLKE